MDKRLHPGNSLKVLNIFFCFSLHTAPEKSTPTINIILGDTLQDINEVPCVILSPRHISGRVQRDRVSLDKLAGTPEIVVI